MAAVYKWRKKTGATGPVIINGAQLPGGKVFGYPSIQCLQAAELFLLEKAQRGLKAAKTRSLNVDTASEKDVNGITRKLVVIGSRGRNQIQRIYGQANLPVLDKEHKLSELYIRPGCPRNSSRGGNHHPAPIKEESVDNPREVAG
jgi:hypothetical protein